MKPEKRKWLYRLGALSLTALGFTACGTKKAVQQETLPNREIMRDEIRLMYGMPPMLYRMDTLPQKTDSIPDEDK